MLTLESWCIPVVIRGASILRMMPNCQGINKRSNKYSGDLKAGPSNSGNIKKAFLKIGIQMVVPFEKRKICPIFIWLVLKRISFDGVILSTLRKNMRRERGSFEPGSPNSQTDSAVASSDTDRYTTAPYLECHLVVRRWVFLNPNYPLPGERGGAV